LKKVLDTNGRFWLKQHQLHNAGKSAQIYVGTYVAQPIFCQN
jgi:hypothetical protein